MQRANGDWFALQRADGLCVPLFSSASEARQARAFNVELLVFTSVVVDERAFKDLAQSVDNPRAYFWLVEKGSTSMRRGMILTTAQVSLLVRDVGREIPAGTEK